MSTRRQFLKVLVGSAACVVTPLAFSSIGCDATCDCGSNLEPDPHIDGRCFECATADEMNRWIYKRGLRPCPHSHHTSDEDFIECLRVSPEYGENGFHLETQ